MEKIAVIAVKNQCKKIRYTKISIGKPDAKKVLSQAIAIKLCGDCVNELKYQIELGGLCE